MRKKLKMPLFAVLCATAILCASWCMYATAEYLMLKNELKKNNIALGIDDLKEQLSRMSNSDKNKKINFYDFAEHYFFQQNSDDQIFDDISEKALEEYVKKRSSLRKTLSGMYGRQEIFYIPDELDTDIVPEKLGVIIVGILRVTDFYRIAAEYSIMTGNVQDGIDIINESNYFLNNFIKIHSYYVNLRANAMFHFWCIRIYEPLLERMPFCDSDMRRFAEMIYSSLNNISENAKIANEYAMIRLLEDTTSRKNLKFYKELMVCFDNINSIFKHRDRLEKLKNAYSCKETEGNELILFSLNNSTQWKTRKNSPESIPVLLKNLEGTVEIYSSLKKSAAKTLILSYSKKYGKSPKTAADFSECFNLPAEAMTDTYTGDSFFSMDFLRLPKNTKQEKQLP